jgi:hypothetical protein
MGPSVMQSPEQLTPSPSAKVFHLPPDPLTAISESGLSGAYEMGARDDLLGEKSVTTSPVVIVPIERPQRRRWPAFVIALALVLTLLWSGTLVWLSYRLMLSALSIV